MAGGNRVEFRARDVTRLITDPALQHVTGRYFDGVRMVGPAAEPRDQKAQALHLATWQLLDAERTTV